MGESKKPEKKKYNTQELLSLNMDRLKEYMKRMAKQASDPSTPPVFEVPSPRPKGGTKIGKTPSACKLLAVFEDPHIFVRLVAENDGRPASRRYGLERASDFKDAVERMTKEKYDLVLLSQISEALDEVQEDFSTLDLILMIRGLMRPSDMYFLAKKRWFVMNLVEGDVNAEKVANFRKLREQYKEVPLIYCYGKDHPEEAKLVAAAEKVRAVPLDESDFGRLFFTLDELAFES
ncbi:MAG: hypothetical protein ACYS47_17200 [Planctomycetota bacterium]|jgi:hypothetical protein